MPETTEPIEASIRASVAGLPKDTALVVLSLSTSLIGQDVIFDLEGMKKTMAEAFEDAEMKSTYLILNHLDVVNLGEFGLEGLKAIKDQVDTAIYDKTKLSREAQ
jgi:hypothetical protein